MKPSRPDRLSRRDFVRLGGVGLAGAALLPAACAPEAGATEIVFATGPDDSGTLPLLIDRFNDAHEGTIRVRVREMDRASDVYYRALTTDLEDGGVDIDVFAADVTWTAAFAEAGHIEDLSARFFDSYDPEDLVEPAMHAVTYRFKVWAVPWFTDAGILYFRKDLLKEAGIGAPPATWDDLGAMARRITARGGAPYGVVFQGAAYEGGTVNALEFIWNAGGRVLGSLTDTGTFGPAPAAPVVLVDMPETANGLDTARRLVAEGVAPGAVTTFREHESARAFLSGDAVFARHWPYVYRLVSDPAQSVLEPAQVGVARLPVSAPGVAGYGCLGGWNLMINARASSGRRDAAWQFIRFMTAPEQQRFRAREGGFLPSLRRLYDDPDLRAAAPVIALAGDAIISARARPAVPAYAEISPRIAEAFQQVLRGERTGAEAAAALHDTLDGLVRPA